MQARQPLHEMTYAVLQTERRYTMSL